MKDFLPAFNMSYLYVPKCIVICNKSVFVTSTMTLTDNSTTLFKSFLRFLQEINHCKRWITISLLHNEFGIELQFK